MPEEFSKWSTVYRQFRRCTLAGLWELVLDALSDIGVAPDNGKRGVEAALSG